MLSSTDAAGKHLTHTFPQKDLEMKYTQYEIGVQF